AAHVEEAHVATVSIEEPGISADAEVPEAEPTTALDDGAVAESVVPAISNHRDLSTVEPDSKHDGSDLVDASNGSTELATEPTEDASQDKLSSVSAVNTTPEEPVLQVLEVGSSVGFAIGEATPHPELTLPHDEPASHHSVVDEAQSNPTS
ncbi:hypothetical protein H0H93_004439, partial [Arthromyces matolae]